MGDGAVDKAVDKVISEDISLIDTAHVRLFMDLQTQHPLQRIAFIFQ